MKLSQINISDFSSNNKVEELYKSLNNNRTEYPKDKSIIDLFHEVCNSYPEYKAIIEDDRSITYEELDKRSNQVANFLIDQGIQKENIVIVYMEKSIAMIVSILGILKSGGAYCPLNTDFPIGRIKYIVNETKAMLVMSESKFLQQINNLLWECETLKSYLCVDVEDISGIVESRNELMDRELWEYVGQTAVDDIAGGGWSDSYTGELLSREILDEYGDNILKKITPFLDKKKKVLEIGCASGISMFRIAPFVDSYFGTDISQAILDYDQKICDERGITNVQLKRLEAEEIDQIEEKNFDIVIINSVVQAFSGHNYLKDIVRKIIGLLSSNGIIFIGDVMDQDLKDELINSLISFKKANIHAKTKLSFTNELFVSKSFFEHLVFDFQEIEKVEPSGKIHTVKCELTEYRYDIILSVNKNNIHPETSVRRQKEWFDNSVLKKFSDDPCNVITSPEQLAYVIFTSGSTGTPKGVLIEQRGVVRLVRNTNYINFTPEDVVSQCIPVSFDPSVWEIFGALLNGSALCLIPQSMLLNFDLFTSYINRNRLTIVAIPAALFAQIADLRPAMFIHLKTIVVGGETLSPKAVSKIRAACPDLQIINAYGPTENTVKSTTYVISSEYSDIPIGKPVANSEAYILDENNNLQSPGIAGELCVAGDGLARGYLNDEKLTRTKFVEHPFEPGKRMYKTGDLARLKSNGNIEFLGRLDHQVKIRGFRIEISEIESKLKDIPQIEEAVVAVVEKKEKYLCAYLKLADTISMDAVRALLSVNLPAFMIPSYYVLMDKFPLTLHGKIDTKALPEPEELNLINSVAYIAPVNDLEISLVKIWEELLGKSRVGTHDNFFEIGGHSLKAVQLTSRISEVFGVKLEIKNVFDYPTVEKMVKLIAVSQKTSYEEIQVAAYQDYYDVSHAQKRLWILDQIEENQNAYHILSANVFNGNLNREAFVQAFEALVQRHESLRTSFRVVKGEPKQKINEYVNGKFNMDYLDMRDEENKEELAQQSIRQQGGLPFDLQSYSLMRAHLIRLEDEKYVFLLAIHHIISDGWSMNILVDEFLFLYHSFNSGNQNVLPPLRIQYKDYAAWQNNQLSHTEFNADKNFWVNYLDGELPVLELPTDFPRPVFRTYNGARTRNIQFDAQLCENLDRLSKSNGASLFMLLIASVNVLFYKYTSQNDIILGSPVAGREHKDLENQIGFYVNTVGLRTQIDAEENFEILLHKVKENILNVYAHQAYPFDRLIEDLDVRPETSRSPLFDVMVALQNIEVKSLGIDTIEEVNIQGYDAELAVSKFDLSFNFTQQDAAIAVSVEYNTDLFTQATIYRLIDHFQALIKSISNNPLLPIKTLEYLSEAEEAQIMHEFNQVKTDFNLDKTIYHYLEDYASQTPDKTAVQFNDKQLSYRDVNGHVNQLAHFLSKKELVNKDDLIVILMDRSEKMVISILAGWKIGGAYLPLDPAYPAEHIKSIVEDSGAKLVITLSQFLSDELEQELRSMVGIVKLDESEQAINHESKQNLNLLTGKENLAYVIYTSGSTGKPKGAMIEHGGMMSHIFCKIEDLQLNEQSIVMQNASQCFDISVWQFFVALVVGGKTVIYDNDTVINPVKLLEKMREDSINIAEVVPSYLSVMLDLIENSHVHQIPNDLNYLLVTGETLKKSLVKRWFKESAIKLINAYGPTEASDDITHLIMTDDIPEMESIPIGRPLPNSRIYIVDQHMKLCPIGIKGEICVSGVGVGRGYVRDPERTKAVFVEDPFQKGTRLYKTGDVGRYLSNGLIEFFGRKDYQVKIKGFRIELEEIERALTNYETVKEAVVDIKEDLAGEKILVAYCVGNGILVSADLRKFLAERIPAYMIPSFFVQLEKLPLTSNGKADRKSLPDPEDLISAIPDVNYQAPRNKVENQLIQIWKEVLGRDKIGITDNFFEMGGHSLKAIQIITRIYKILNVNVEVRSIYTNPTIEGLALVIRQSAQVTFQSINPVVTQPYYDLSSSQRRLWILDQIQEGQIAYNIPGIYVFNGELKVSTLQTVFEILVKRHESLRTTFVSVAGEPKQKITAAEDVSVAINFTDLRSDTDKQKKAKELAGVEIGTPFNLESGPLIRLTLIQLEDNQFIFLFVIHHIVSDGWSIEVFIDEALALYGSLIEGKEADLPPLAIQYKDYAAWQNDQLSGENSISSQEFWTAQFSGEIPVLELPYINQRPAFKTYNGKTAMITLSEEVSQKIREVSNKFEMSKFMFLIASINTLFYKYTGQQDIILGSPVSGRNHADLEGQIGFYVNTIPIRTVFNGEDSFAILLSAVKENLLDIYTNQNYPFDKLVDELSLKRDTSRSPLFDVMVVLQNIELETLTQQEMKDISIQNYETDFSVSKFDLTFNFSESAKNIYLSLEYNTDLFSTETIDRMLANYETLLDYVVQHTDSSLNGIGFLSADEKQTLIKNFDASEIAYKTETTIQEMFQEQSAESPENYAVIFGNDKLTYQELNCTSNQLADYLRVICGIQSEDLVGVMVNRSQWMITAVMSVLKAGAAYVPIDPGYPSGRIEFIRNDANLKVLIVDTEEIKEKYQSDSCKVISLEKLKELLPAYSNINPSVINMPENLAYVIYTSGTTGVPKGVQIEHKSIANTLLWRKEYYGLDEKVINLQIPSIAFDSSVEDVFSILITGGTLVILQEELRYDLNYLSSMIREHAVTHFLCVPSLYKALLEEVSEELLNMKTVTVAGESIGEDLVQKHFKLLPGVELINEYGPTENSVCSTVSKLEPGKSVTIGKHISNVLTYILDDRLELLPLGTIGEICVAGPGLARGYLNREVLNLEKFVDNPYHTKYTKLYRTGDYGKFLADGSIKFLGRKDDQVKIRGYRVELNEIENALSKLEYLDEVIVVAKSGSNDSKYLVAYLMSKETVKSDDLQKYLSDLLPSYMIPSHYVKLDQLPLNSNGKLDRKVLENLALDEVKTETELPDGPVEEELISIWEKLLIGQEIGTDQNFFDLGGDSIKATQIVARMYKAGYKISVRDIFKNPTIKLLGKIAEKVSRPSDQGLVEGIIPLTPIQKDFFSTQRLKPHHYNQAALLVFNEGFSEDNIRNIFKEIIQHHDALRINFKRTQDGYIQMNNVVNSNVPLQITDLRNELNPTALLEEKCNEIQSSINMEDGSLIKLCLFKQAEGDSLLIVIHHLIIDGISWRILLEDFSTLFEQIQKNEILSLPLKTDSFKLWSENLQEYANGKDFLKEINYWEQLLTFEDGGFTKDFAYESNVLQDAKKLTIALDREETSLLLTKVNFAYNTEINDILLAGLGISIQTYFKQNEFILALENHGREEILKDFNVTRTIGWFTSIYPLKITVSDNDISRQIKEVKEILRKVPNKGIGYGILKHLTAEEYKTGLDFKVKPKMIFNYLGQFDSDLSDSKFEISSEHVGQLQDINEEREYDFDINGLIADGQLIISITFNKNHYRDETIQGWLNQYRESLNQIIYHCSERDQKELTPSDMGHNKLSIDDIELLESIFNNNDN